MDCLNPYHVDRGSKQAAPFSGGFLVVPCGQCRHCKVQRTAEWTMRLLHESEYWSEKCFVTLTYSEENLPADGNLRKRDLQTFFKRLRKRGHVFRYYACGEYGEKFGRPHYHAILFGLDNQDEINQTWALGRVHCGSVEPDSIRYVAQYIDKKHGGAAFNLEGRINNFQICSQGLGKRYLQDNLQELAARGVRYRGTQRGLPRYYLKKIKEWVHTGEIDRCIEDRVKATLSDRKREAEVTRNIREMDHAARSWDSKFQIEISKKIQLRREQVDRIHEARIGRRTGKL